MGVLMPRKFLRVKASLRLCIYDREKHLMNIQLLVVRYSAVEVAQVWLFQKFEYNFIFVNKYFFVYFFK